VRALSSSAHVLRARRTAAVARATLSGSAVALVLVWPSLAVHPSLEVGGFAFIVFTSLVQLLLPRLRWLKVEESVAGLAGPAAG
jgi:hypothetical protein